jgi:GH15 family glucan-1,4-alpha-glucosidase
MSTLNLGIIGNSTIAGLIDDHARLIWMCLPRLDGDPVFDELLGGKGTFSIWLEGLVETSQKYERNTAILRTTMKAADGSALEIVDFAPQFQNRGRMFRPACFVRRIRVLSGSPQIKIQMTPQGDWGEKALKPKRGVHHIRYTGENESFRVTTDAPISYVLSGMSFILDRDIAFICGRDETVSDNMEFVTRDWEERTAEDWRHWTRHLAIPLDWQESVIRAAITLKLCVYEETGGIVAALTTSIPEHEGSERNWDYRFCWVRDAYFTVTALNRLASMGTLEHYMRFVRNVVAHAKGGHIQPVYGIGVEADLTESLVETLPGYRDHGPVRKGNQAAEHVQHDVYGHVVLGAAQSFFDTRLLSTPGEAEFKQLEPVGERAFAVHDTPDAGIWEFRTIAHVHTSSAIMCWAACDRLGKIAAHLKLTKRAKYWRERASIIRQHVIENAWNPEIKAFTAYYGGESLDASVLLMAEIGFIDASDPCYVGTVEAIDRDLRRGDHVYRYKTADDFGQPKTAFTACTFWHIDALHRIGKTAEAKAMFESVLKRCNHLGLLSEDVDVETNELWGNFPQTYSMVGIINSASLLSRKWSEVV